MSSVLCYSLPQKFCLFWFTLSRNPITLPTVSCADVLSHLVADLASMSIAFHRIYFKCALVTRLYLANLTTACQVLDTAPNSIKFQRNSKRRLFLEPMKKPITSVYNLIKREELISLVDGKQKERRDRKPPKRKQEVKRSKLRNSVNALYHKWRTL